MKLEEATKEELIWFIRKNSFTLKNELDSFEFDIMMRRNSDYHAKAKAQSDKCLDLLAEYEKVVSPYNGKPLSSVPESILKKAKGLLDAYKAASEARDRYYKLADKCLKQIEREES